MNMMSDPNASRKGRLGLLAKASPKDVARHWAALNMSPDYIVLRSPEIGGVMVRGRAGAVGAAFNLGEMTVTRASIKLSDGAVGHGYVQGRMQTEVADSVEAGLLAPLRKAMVASKTMRAAKAAATKVDFFTIVRGED